MSKLDTPFIVFQGGGYDGCFWEWNIISFEKPAESHKLKAKRVKVTGRAGTRVISAFERGALTGVRAAAEEGEFEIVNTDERWKKFNDDFNKGLVRSTARALGLSCKCDKCDKWFDADEIVHTGYRGDGGIGVQFDDNHCRECAEELHEDWFAKHGWKYLSIEDRVKAIQKYNEENGGEISIFAARSDDNCPVSYLCCEGYDPEFY